MQQKIKLVNDNAQGNTMVGNQTLAMKLIGDINHLLDMARYYVDEQDNEMVQILELTKTLTTTLQREGYMELG